MSVEGDRRPGVLENHVEQHHRISHSEAEASESHELNPFDVRLETNGNFLEKLTTLLVFCLGLFACCLVFVIVVFSHIHFIQILTQTVKVLNETDYL